MKRAAAKGATPARECFHCLHYEACQSWNVGSLASTNAEKCVNYRSSIPPDDMRSVVLCRDCRDSYVWTNMNGENYRYCGYLRDRWNHDTDRMVDDEDFCKWGKKRPEQCT